MSQYSDLLKNLVNLYTEETLNDLSIALDPEEYSLEQIQDNINVIALITEGLGRVSEVLKMSFQPYLLNVLYLVLEKAGNSVQTSANLYVNITSFRLRSSCN